ncbi:MAG: silent information regulator protein Sir2, partial [Roseovarius sp.]
MKLARAQGVTVVGISDSHASPIEHDAHHRFVVAADTPQYFPASVSTIALLVTHQCFVIALASV